jgi:tetratricopeptide (TPR) repeat protein
VTLLLVREVAYAYGLEGKARWFDEGLARYLQTLRLDADRTLTYGDVEGTLLSNVTRGSLASFDSLWEPVTPATRTAFIVTSWLAVHYLFNHEPQRFQDFQQRVIATGDARGAWRAAFPDLPPAVMDERLATYAFREGTFATFKTHLPPVRYEARATMLTDADVHAVRALLYATAHEPRLDLARAELAEAFRLDPTLVTAAYVQRAVIGDDVTELELPKRLVARHPGDAMAWLLLARARTARHETEEAKEALEEARRFGATPEGPVPVELRIARPD